MNTDMSQYLIFRYASTVVRKMTAYELCCAGLARSPFVLTEHISSNNVHIDLELEYEGMYVCTYGINHGMLNT